MKLIGITGGIATGKSTAVKMLKYLNYHIFDADHYVALMYENNHYLLKELQGRFPDVFCQGRLDKAKLAKRIFTDSRARTELEAFIHPLVKAKAMKFYAFSKMYRRKVIFWDMPLLFETGLHVYCDCVMVMHCPTDMQRRRVLQRGWSEERFQGAVAAQIPIKNKIRMADQVITSALGKSYMMHKIKHILGNI